MKKQCLALFMAGILGLSQGLISQASENAIPLSNPDSPEIFVEAAQSGSESETAFDWDDTFVPDGDAIMESDLEEDFVLGGEDIIEFDDEDYIDLTEDIILPDEDIIDQDEVVTDPEDDLIFEDEESLDAQLPATVKLDTTSYTYDGKVKKPSLIIKGKNGTTVSSNNYTVSYSKGRKNVGQYTVKVTFKGGGYTGSKTLNFTIKPPKTSIKALKVTSKGITASWSKKTTQTTGYNLQYSNDSSFSSKKSLTIKSNTTTKKAITGLNAGSTYYFRMRTYKTVNGKKIYSKWSAVNNASFDMSGTDIGFTPGYTKGTDDKMDNYVVIPAYPTSPITEGAIFDVYFKGTYKDNDWFSPNETIEVTLNGKAVTDYKKSETEISSGHKRVIITLPFSKSTGTVKYTVQSLYFWTSWDSPGGSSYVKTWTFDPQPTATVNIIASQDPENEGVSIYESNLGLNEYGGNYARNINSYLVETKTGYQRLQSLSNGQIIIENYDSSYNFKSKKYLKNELPLFGGFYSGKDYNFIVYGQSNPEESDNKEVLRVVKYDKDFKKLDSVSYRGINTVVPFDAGSLRMDEYNGYLYIRTCHKMFKSSDGRNHQANMTFEIKQSDMKDTYSAYEVSFHATGYVSHSFNQYILVDDKANIVGLDHGDAYPRSVTLGVAVPKAGTGNIYDDYWNARYDAIDILSISGKTGDNYTGVRVGGLSYSSNSYITVGSSINQKDFDNSKTYNVYVTATPKSSPLVNTTFKTITSYKEGGSTSAGTPSLVKMGDNKFLVIWALQGTDQVSYVFIDGKGNTTGSIKTEKARLSSCPPIYSDGKIRWYTADGGKLTFYSIDGSGNLGKQEFRR